MRNEAESVVTVSLFGMGMGVSEVLRPLQLFPPHRERLGTAGRHLLGLELIFELAH